MRDIYPNAAIWLVRDTYPKRSDWKFSADTTSHGLRITKRPAVWNFSLWKISISIGNILSLFTILKRFQKVKKFERCPFRRLCSQSTKRSKSDTLKKFSSDSFRQNSKILWGNCKMTNGEFFYRKTVDYMFRMALEKDDLRRFSVIWEFCVTGSWVGCHSSAGIFLVWTHIWLSNLVRAGMNFAHLASFQAIEFVDRPISKTLNISLSKRRLIQSYWSDLLLAIQEIRPLPSSHGLAIWWG